MSKDVNFPGPNSKKLLEIRDKNISKGVSYVLPIFIKQAKGPIIEDIDGNEFIDFTSGIGVTNFGNNHPMVVEAIKEQADKLLHSCFMVTMYEPYVQLAAKLNAMTPGDHDKKTAFFNSGAEVVENAVKISRRYTKKTGIVSLECAFHGRTLLTMTLTSKVKPYKYGFGPFAPECYKIPSPYCYRCRFGLTYPECDLRCANYLEDFFKLECPPDYVAAVIAEPVQGEGGFIVPPMDYFKRLKEICHANDILLVLDEVQSGFFRTGKAFASEHFDVVPDIMTMAKSLAGGLPLSAATGRAEVMDAVGPGEIGGTYSGNPLACAAALAVIEASEKEKIADQATATGKAINDRLKAMQEKYDLIGDVRGLGAMQALELVKDRKTKEPAADEVKEITAYCHSKGLLVISAGVLGNVIRLLMPVNIDAETRERGLDILEEGIAKVQNK